MKLYDSQRRVTWLRRADINGNGGVVTLRAAAPARDGEAAPIGRIAIRDASCRVGEALVVAAARGQAWARIMMSHIALRIHDHGPRAGLGE